MSLKIRDFAEVYNVKDITTQEMKNAIDDWFNLYYGKNTPVNENNNLRLAFTMVSKISKAVFSEYTIEANKGDEFTDEVIKALNRSDKRGVQQALIGGICWLKPLIFGKKLGFSVIPRDNAIILGRDEANEVIDMGTEEDSEEGGKFYTLFERRRINSKGRLTIESRLYESDNRTDKGKRVPLSTLERYEGIEDETEIPIDNIGLIPVVCPMVNCVDGTDDAVSIYAPAVGRIHDANINEYQLCGEFNRGESRVFASADLLKRTSNGSRALVDNLFVGLDDDPQNAPMTIFSPQLREMSFLTRKNAYLRDLEGICGIKHGLISDANEVQKTATEITSSDGEYNLTIIDFQRMWEDAARLAVEIVADLKEAYKQPVKRPAEDALIINWGNGVLYDRDKTWAEYVGMVQMGLLKPELAIAWYFDLPHETDADIEKIRTEYMPQIEQMIEGE